jgi:hypothetical protein
MARKKSSLARWIDSVGADKLAKIFKVNLSTVGHWRSGHCLPRSHQMFRIKRLTKGVLTCDTMIDQHFSGATKKRA